MENLKKSTYQTGHRVDLTGEAKKTVVIQVVIVDHRLADAVEILKGGKPSPDHPFKMKSQYLDKVQNLTCSIQTQS